MEYSYDDLKTEFRLSNDDGDSWGSVMAWLFAIADEITFYRNPTLNVPNEWEFRPSPLGADTETQTHKICHQAKDIALVKLGDTLWRYRAKLIVADKDY
jgi:hypothetical protein